LAFQILSLALFFLCFLTDPGILRGKKTDSKEKKESIII